MGALMIKGAFAAARAPALALVAAMALGAGSTRAEDPQTCVLAKVGELAVKFQDNRPMVPVSINGQPAWFLIDTGASNTMIWGGAAKSLGLRLYTSDGVKFYGVGGGRDAMYASVATFGLAGATAKGLDIFAIDQPGSAQDAGVLGRDLLGAYDIEFDLASSTVRLWQSRHCGDRSLAYWTDAPQQAQMRHGGPFDEYRIKLMINGAPVDAILDSGATTSVVTTLEASDAGVHAKDLAPGGDYDQGIGRASVKVQVATFDTVAIGSEQIQHARLQVGDLFADDVEVTTGSHVRQKVDVGQSSMLLGADFLRSHRVFIAAGQHLLYFTYSGGPVFQIVGEAVKPTQTASTADLKPPPSAK
jgi:predicted aspartyl protease